MHYFLDYYYYFLIGKHYFLDYGISLLDHLLVFHKLMWNVMDLFIHSIHSLRDVWKASYFLLFGSKCQQLNLILCFPERGKLADPFYRLEHEGEDLQKKKEAEPVLVRLQRVSDARHSDDYSLNKALRAQLRVCYRANFWFLSSFLSCKIFKKISVISEPKEESCWRGVCLEETWAWHSIATSNRRRCSYCSTHEVLFQVWEEQEGEASIN